MTNEIKNVPELRFPGFEGEWRLINLKNCFHTIKNGFVGTATPFYTDNSGVRYLQSNNVKNGFLNDNVKIYVTKEFNEKYKSNQLKSGDMLMVQSGHAGATAVVSDAYEGSNCHALIIMKPKSNINTIFLNNYFQSGKGVKSIYSLITGNTIKHILSSDVKKITFSTPVIGEQEKIGNFFSKLDRQIELEEQKLAKLEEQKKGYMQQIFSQQLRFKDENGNDYPEWKKKKLDDVANYRRGSFPQPYGNKEWYDEKNGEPFVQVVDVDKNMKLHDKTKQKISDLAKPKSVKGFTGDIVVTLQGSIGRVALLHYDAYIDRTLLLIDSFKIEMNKNYFKYVLYLLFLKEKERAPGGTIKTITKKVLSNFKIDIPNVGEQEKIGSFFKNLDEFIEKQANKVELLKQRKQSFLQKMFV
jgi:type I restriction enzyme S subunit